MHELLIVASTSEHSSGLLQALGIDWKLLVEQALAFLILVGVLAKFVYPTLMKAVDNRRDEIEAGLKEAKESREALVQAEAKVDEVLATARQDADAIIARAHTEAGAMIADAEAKAAARAEQIVTDARAQLDNDVRKARQALKAETVQLVAAATEHILHEKLDAKKDASLITRALEEK